MTACTFPIDRLAVRSHRRSVDAVAALARGVAIALAALVPIAAAHADSPCVDHVIRIDEPCSGDACHFRHVAATEWEGVRHVVWRQNEPTLRVRTARIVGDVVELGEIPITTAVSTNPIRAVAARGDLLAIALAQRVDLHRLVDQEWAFEASLTLPGFSFTAFRLAIDTGGDVERVVVSRKDLLGNPSGSAPVDIFRRDGDWSLEATLTTPGMSFNFGADIAIDGNTIAIGAPETFSTFSGGGLRVQIYEFADAGWTLTETVEGYPWSANSSGHRIALAGNMLVATNAIGDQSLQNIGQLVHLQFWHRGADGFAPSDFILGTTSLKRGWELKALPDGDDVRVFATVYRQLPVTDAAFAYRVRDGVVVESTTLPTPDAESLGFFAPCWGIAAVGGATPWVAVTAPDDPLGSSVSVITLDGPTPCPNEPQLGPVFADLNGDGVVDAADLGALLSQWGSCRGGSENCPADLNGDGVVDGADLGLLLENWSG